MKQELDSMEGLKAMGLICAKFVTREEIFDQNSRLKIPQITAEVISKIKPQVSQALSQENFSTTYSDAEPVLRELVDQFARDSKEAGSSFEIGVSLGCFCFEQLNKFGFNFPRLEPEVIQSFEQTYRETFFQYLNLSLSLPNQKERTNFLKGMLLFGFLHHKFHYEENPELMNLFESFGADRPLVTEGAVLVYELKMRQYLKSIEKTISA